MSALDTMVALAVLASAPLLLLRLRLLRALGARETPSPTERLGRR